MRNITPTLFLFFLFTLIYGGLGYYLTIPLQTYHNDAIARTALGFFTIFGRNPHLGAIGFVWQPLLSLLEIPLLFFLHPFGLQMLSGPLVTAFLGALSVLFIHKTGLLVFEGKQRLTAFFIALLYGINPMIALYSAIGTSEILFICTLLGGIYFFTKWFYTHTQSSLLVSSFLFSLSFWSRYEAIPVFVTCIVLIIIKVLKEKRTLKEAESIILQFGIPLGYSVGFWLFINLLIMKDAFYFIHSPYSNGAFTTNLKTNPAAMEYSYQSITHSFMYVLKRIMYLSPITLFLPISILTFIPLRKKWNDVLLFLFLTTPFISILLFHMYQLYKGDSFGWLRFYMYSIMLGTVFAIYLCKKARFLTFTVFILLYTGIFTSAYAINASSLGKEEVSFITKIQNPSTTLDFSRSYADQKAVAAFMDNQKGKILLDTDKGFAIPLFAKDARNYIITSDVDFEKIVKNYSKKVSWVIVQKPGIGEERINKIYYYYPTIWDGKAPHVTLYKQIYDWKIFKVENTKNTNI